MSSTLDNDKERYEAVIVGDETRVRYTAAGANTFISKTMPTVAFARALMESQRSTPEDEAVRYIQPYLRIAARKNGAILRAYEYPERLAPMKYNEGTLETVNTVIPWTLFFVVAKLAGQTFAISNTYIFSLTGPVRGPDTQMYYWPGGNAFNDGSICFGHVRFPTIKAENELEVVPSMFFNSIFNSDLEHEYIEPFSGRDGYLIKYSYQLFFEHLAYDEDRPVLPFPYDRLKKASTVGTFLQTLAGGF